MTTGSTIFASDYVAIQDKAQALLGIGSGNRGYGQTVQSSDVFVGNEITKDQWDLLRYDIINIRLHQDGVLPNIVTINRGDPIVFGASHPNTNYNTLLETAITNKFQVAGNQSVVSSKGSVNYSSSWSNSAQFTLTVTGVGATNNDKANNLRYFFNSGGKVRISSSISGGSSTAQVNAWKNILTSVATRSFGADTDPVVNYYTLTSSYQTYFQQSLSTPYSANEYRLEARTDVANNSSGTATTLFLRVSLNDAYVDTQPSPPSDLVDGTLTISVEELKASGTLVPSGAGSFTITSPAYSLSSITAT